MSIKAGVKFGPYEIVAPLGSGGMGEVYRARDARIGREVALKILPSHFSADADRLRRFEQEARTAGLLNHPNLLGIFDLGKEEGSPYIVSELLEGETLREKLRTGPLPTRRAVDYAMQLASGLAAAHDRGIIHRDLKPENLFITKDGRLKILDFGLAKLHLPEPVLSDGHSQLGTIASESTPGMILGTVGYMSPEQVRGLPSDQRSDIFAFGAVLFEMLTGKRAFAGNTPADTMSAILQKDPPDLSQSGSGGSPALERILRHCMEKEPDQRFQSARDVGFALEALSGTSDSQTTGVLSSTEKNRQWLWKFASLLLFLIAAGAIAILFLRKPSTPQALEAMHLDVTYPFNIEPFAGLAGGFAVSPDGQSIAMIGVRDGMRRLYIRRLNQTEPMEITDGTGVNGAIFTTDRLNVIYVSGGTNLVRLSLGDQQRTRLTEGVDISGSVAWSPSVILFNRGGALWSIPTQGGDLHQLTKLDESRHEVFHNDPVILPGGRIALFSSLTTEPGTERIEGVSLEDGRRWVVLERAITPVLSPTGHLLFGRDGAILAVPFDKNTAKPLGPGVAVIPSGVVGTVRTGSVGIRISQNGNLVFLPIEFGTKSVVSVGKDGSETIWNLPSNTYFNPRISPDERRLVIEYKMNAIDSVDILSGTRARLIPYALGTGFPIWTSNGEKVVFRRFNVPFSAPAYAGGEPEPVPAGSINDFPSSPGPDSDTYIGNRIQPKTSSDIYLFSISGKFPPKPLIMTPAYEGGAQLSVDGKWLIYQSNESGQAEIYVRSYPGLDRAWQVSEGGGLQPRWSRQNSEIYYRTGRQMMAVAFNASGTEPTFGKPVSLFSADYDYGQGLSIANYDVTKDGRFIMLRRDTYGSSLGVVIHWTEELKKILANGGAKQSTPQ